MLTIRSIQYNYPTCLILEANVNRFMKDLRKFFRTKKKRIPYVKYIYKVYKTNVYLHDGEYSNIILGITSPSMYNKILKTFRSKYSIQDLGEKGVFSI